LKHWLGTHEDPGGRSELRAKLRLFPFCQAAWLTITPSVTWCRSGATCRSRRQAAAARTGRWVAGAWGQHERWVAGAGLPRVAPFRLQCTKRGPSLPNPLPVFARPDLQCVLQASGAGSGPPSICLRPAAAASRGAGRSLMLHSLGDAGCKCLLLQMLLSRVAGLLAQRTSPRAAGRGSGHKAHGYSNVLNGRTCLRGGV